jgi:hypothetical protein
MSYIKAAKTELHESMLEVGIARIQKGTEELDHNLDDEMLDFVLGLIAQVNELAEGEALVVWKEIF